MTAGSAIACPAVNGLHDAECLREVGSVADAYGFCFQQDCAACHALTIDPFILLQYRHTAQYEDSFTSVFRAISKAQKLRFSVLCDEWSGKSYPFPCDGFNHIPSDVCIGFHQCSSIAARFPKDDAKSMSPCCPARKHVKFNPRVIVCQDDCVLPVHHTEIEDFHLWPGKTWQLRRTRSSHRCAFVCDVSKLYAFLDPLVLLPPLSQTVVSHDCPYVSQEPLSPSAVLIRESPNASGLQVSPNVAVQPSAHVDLHQHDPYSEVPPRLILDSITNSNHDLAGTQPGNDVSSFMQRSGKLCKELKSLPNADDPEALIAAFGHEHDAMPADHSSDEGIDARSAASSSDVSIDDSEIAPPSSSGSRQDAILYHLTEAPLRVLLAWSDYDSMIDEIARHYGRNPIDIIDAYEVEPSPADVPDGVVSIIVHMFADIAVGQSVKLALLDVDLHGHSFEANYAVGPMSTRSVVRLPTQCTRDAVLVTANVDRYCRQEDDACFVWHGHSRWHDDDFQVRRLSHGAYFRVAVPPTQRFVCTTQNAVEMAQSGLSHQEVLDQLTGAEVISDASPTLLSEAELADLATPNILSHEVDIMHAMQISCAVGHVPQPSSNSVGQRSESACVDSGAPVGIVAGSLPHDMLDDLSPAQSPANVFQFDPAAPVFFPGASDPALQDENMLEIFMQWQAAADAWEDEMVSAKFLTWRV